MVIFNSYVKLPEGNSDHHTRQDLKKENTDEPPSPTHLRYSQLCVVPRSCSGDMFLSRNVQKLRSIYIYIIYIYIYIRRPRPTARGSASGQRVFLKPAAVVYIYICTIDLRTCTSSPSTAQFVISHHRKHTSLTMENLVELEVPSKPHLLVFFVIFPESNRHKLW